MGIEVTVSRCEWLAGERGMRCVAYCGRTNGHRQATHAAKRSDRQFEQNEN
jgi:hypothetical protein